MTAADYIIQRRLEAPPLTVNADIKGARINVLTDADGDNLRPYLDFFSGGSETKVKLIQGDQEVALSSVYRAGFNEIMQPGITVSAFLRSIGVEEAELPKVMSRYDLSRLSYLNCVQISASAQRQLKLIEAIRTSAPLLVMNDPFQPFSGRWREQFAEELSAHAKDSGCTIVILNLGFMPKIWQTNAALMHQIDVKELAVRAIDRAVRAEKERELAAKAAAAKAPAQGTPVQASAAPINISPDGKPIDEAKVSMALAKNWKENCLVPFARLSQFLRTTSGAIAAVCLAVVVASLAVIVVPALRGGPNGIGALAKLWGEPEVKLETPVKNKKTAAEKDTVKKEPGADEQPDDDGGYRDEEEFGQNDNNYAYLKADDRFLKWVLELIDGAQERAWCPEGVTRRST